MELVDTHAHLCDEAFDLDRAEVLERARAVGVVAIVAVGESLPDARRNLELAEEFPELVRPAAGLFPTRLDSDEAAAVEELIRSRPGRWAAIGEVGLDLWKVRDEEGRETQRRIFTRFIHLARELDLPLNVHSRAAGRQTIELLLAEGATRVQLHAFDGRAAKADPAIEAGYFFSVPPSVVRSPQKQKLVRRLPLDCLLLETDSPVLGPDPAERNEPARVTESLDQVCRLKGLDRDRVAETVAANTKRLYGDLSGPARD